jgi:hypothetical protein
MKLRLSLCDFLLGALEFGDVSHYRHRAARRDPAAADPVDTAIGRAVLERFTRGVAQTLHPLGDLGIVAVVSVLGQIAKEARIRASRLKQLLRRRVHFPETVVAGDDV